MAGSALQLVVNLVGMTIAGFAVLSAQRLLTARRERIPLELRERGARQHRGR